MTVYSINKGVLEQAINQAPASKAAVSPEAAFVAALQSAATRIGVTGEAPANAAFKDRFDRPVERRPEPDAAERGSRTQPRNDARDHEVRRSDRDSRRAANEPADRRVERPADARADQPREAADVSTQPSREAPAESETNVSANDTGSEPQTAEPTAVAETSAPVSDTSQQAVQASAQLNPQNIVTVADGTADTNQDPLAGLDKTLAGVTEEQPGQAAAGDAADGEGMLADSPLLAADADSADTADVTATSAQQTQAKQGSGRQALGHTEQAQRQAEDLADMLAGTGANVKVKVTTDKSATQATDTSSAQTDIASDLMFGQAEGAETVGDDLPNNGQNQGGQSQTGQGTANAAQQLVRNGAMENIAASQGRAMDARPFAAALAAQAEAAAPQSGPSNTGSQSAQPVAGLTGTGAAQTAQKGAAAQAAQAPQQPRFVEPKQVIDQISVQIGKQAKDGAETIRVQLKPADLGSIEIKMEVQDGRVTTHVTADNRDTLAALQRDARGLEKALQDAGLRTDQGSMTFSLSGEGQQAQRENGQQQGRSGRRSRLARAHEASEVGLAANAQPMRSGGRAGVDIRV